MKIVFGETRYAKYSQSDIKRIWKELRRRFLDETVDPSDSAGQIRGDMELEEEEKLNKRQLGEFAIELLHWKPSEKESDIRMRAEDEWKLLSEGESLRSTCAWEEMPESERMKVRHKKRQSKGMEISPNVPSFTVAQVRLFCEQIRAAEKEIDASIVVYAVTNTTLADFAIRYLCASEFRRYLLKKQKIKSSD